MPCILASPYIFTFYVRIRLCMCVLSGVLFCILFQFIYVSSIYEHPFMCIFLYVGMCTYMILSTFIRLCTYGLSTHCMSFIIWFFRTQECLGMFLLVYVYPVYNYPPVYCALYVHLCIRVLVSFVVCVLCTRVFFFNRSFIWLGPFLCTSVHVRVYVYVRLLPSVLLSFNVCVSNFIFIQHITIK